MISRRTAEAYDRIASVFARIHATMPDTLVDYGHRFLSLIGPNARVLDVGCGVGRDMAWMEAQGARVTGFDLSVGMLAQARRRVRGELLQGDMRRLPFPDGTFAGVWCIAALLHLPKADAPAALAEVRRVTVGQRLRLWADEIHAIANEGLHFEGDNPYSARRCRRLLRIAVGLFALQDVILCHCSSSSSQSSTYGTPPTDLINVYA